jgi:energy-converting hydrogenase Eha subunit A
LALPWHRLFLGSIAAFVSLMSSRLAAATDRLRAIRSSSVTDANDPDRQRYIGILLRRVKLLQSAIRASLVAGVTATMLLGVLFLTEYLGLRYAYGAGILFTVATICLGIALIRFAQETWIGLSEMDHW